MALQLGLITGIQQVLKYDSYFHVTPLEWNEKDGKFQVYNTIRSKFWRCFAMFLSFASSTLTIVECLKPLSTSVYTTIGFKLMAFSTASLVFFAFIMVCKMDQNPHTIIKVLNGLIDFEREIGDECNPSNFKCRIVAYSSKLFFVTLKCACTLLGITSVIEPAFPASIISCLQNVLGRDSYLLRITSFFANQIGWHLVGSLSMVFLVQILVTIVCVTGYLKCCNR